MTSLIILIDGLGDDPIPAWNGLTPFDRSYHPAPSNEQAIAEVLIVDLIWEFAIAIAVFCGIGGLDEHFRASFLIIGVIERIDVNGKSKGVFGEFRASCHRTVTET